jgi:hypothetical protein
MQTPPELQQLNHWSVNAEIRMEEDARNYQLQLEREERERQQQLEQARIDRLLDARAVRFSEPRRGYALPLRGALATSRAYLANNSVTS